MQELNLTRNYTSTSAITTRLMIWSPLRRCGVKNLQYSFFLEDCYSYRSGTLLEVTGSLTPLTDKDFFQPKRLTVQHIEPVTFSPGSVKGWGLEILQNLLSFKLFLLEKISQGLSSQVTALVGGMVFGGTAALSPGLNEAFRTTGLTHVVSASGYNVSVVASLCQVVTNQLFSTRVSAVFSIILVWCYAILAELVPPVVRSALMITFYLVAKRIFFRQYQVMFSLILASLLMIWWQPYYLASLSFWLSVLSTAGICLFLPVLTGPGGWFYRQHTGQIAGGMKQQLSSLLTESWWVTIAAQSLTTPLVLVVFGEVSLLSLVTNTTLLWLTPLITLSGLALMGLSLIFPVLAAIFSLGVELLGSFFLGAVTWFGQFKWGMWRHNFAWWQAALWWGILSLVIKLHQYRHVKA